MTVNWILRNALLLDPAANQPERGDLFVTDGKITADPPRQAARVVEADGLALMPALIDAHVHFREPGNEESETITTGALAAARGGFGTVVTMPNTRPPIDTPAAVRDALRRGNAAGHVDILPTACITVERRGTAVAPLAALADAGAVAFTDDGATVADDTIMAAAMRLARQLNKPVLDHALAAGADVRGVMHAGARAAALGLPGIPREAEDRMVARDLALAESTGCAMHIQHISSATAVSMLRDARRRGAPVSGEVTPHHLALRDEDIPGDDADFKMNPPLRSSEDRAALAAGLHDGTITVLATDHAPHTARLKAAGFRAAPFGVVGLETALGVTYRILVSDAGMPVLDWLRAWTAGPAAVLGLPAPSLQPGNPATLVLADLDTDWTVDRSAFLSRSHNTPFEGFRCRGQAVMTLRRGRIAWIDKTRRL